MRRLPLRLQQFAVEEFARRGERGENATLISFRELGEQRRNERLADYRGLQQDISFVARDALEAREDSRANAQGKCVERRRSGKR